MAGTLDKVRIGIIGCGGIANGKHMPSLSTTEQHRNGRVLRHRFLIKRNWPPKNTAQSSAF